MDAFAFWQQKIIQFFHDPPSKPFGGTKKTGKHTTIAKALFDRFQTFNEGRKWRYWFKAADWAAAGADRPMLMTPKKKGVRGLGTVTWPKEPVIVHPLAPGYRLHLAGQADTGTEREDPFEDERGEPRDLIDEEQEVSGELAGLLQDWTNKDALQKGFIPLWRRFRDELIDSYPNDPLWQELPADSRCPDHSIWDHLKVTTALAFIKPHKMSQPVGEEGAREPWMLRVSLGPVGAFIGQSRTSRDLWISSYLLADLAWSAMRPIVERYGPDSIVYPDLRANPRADCWLFGAYPEALPEAARNPSTFAAVLPDAFVALVPRGGEGHLIELGDLAAESQKAVAARWGEYADHVHGWLQGVLDQGDAWQAIWKRQQARCPIHVTWMAVPWKPLERIKHEASLRGPALPAQRPGPPRDTEDAEAIAKRRARLAPWVPRDAWVHYELARDVFAHSSLIFHQIERGFDYALTHHQLRIRHAMREAADPAPIAAEEPGEKCTLCGQREALHGGTSGDARLGKLRQQTRKFWQRKDLDPEQAGEDRLCAICATKRFLIKADGSAQVFNRLWIGMATPPEEVRDRDGELRLPFPSAATIAAQKFIEEVADSRDCRAELENVVRAAAAADQPRTSFPRALPRLAAQASKADRVVGEFLKYEAEDVLFPEVLDGKIQGLPDDKNREPLKALRRTVQALRKKAAECGFGVPATRLAVIRLDGDRMGALLLGEASAIETRWRDVLHPEVLRRLEDPKKADHLKQAGWPALLNVHRLMGPSLHAFVSRALGQFSHRIVPWVVEREFSGRLIYAGGDDVLCLAPADEAIDLAARLQQLFSAAWVVDTDPPADQWGWRRKDWDGRFDDKEAWRRFVIPLAGRDEKGAPVPIELGQPGQRVAPHAADERQIMGEMEVRGLLLPMLGTGASLSAGIAIAHYKTPLSVQLRRSKELLDLAKNTGRRALALGHASRGGDKTRFSIPWNDPVIDPDRSGRAILKQAIEGFAKGRLPGRLPYKLRELAPAARCGLAEIGPGENGAEHRDRLLRGLFASCLDGPGDRNAQAAAFALWRRGIDIAGEDEARFTDGLLLCRELARGGDAGEEGL